MAAFPDLLWAPTSHQIKSPGICLIVSFVCSWILREFIHMLVGDWVAINFKPVNEARIDWEKIKDEKNIGFVMKLDGVRKTLSCSGAWGSNLKSHESQEVIESVFQTAIESLVTLRVSLGDLKNDLLYESKYPKNLEIWMNGHCIVWFYSQTGICLIRFRNYD